eukprot:UN3267
MKFGNLFCEEYRRQLKDALRVNDELATTLQDATLSTGFPGNSISNQLKQVARLIAARETRKAERDVFFTQFGHFDHHQNLAAGLRALLPQVNSAIQAFVTDLKAHG